VFSLLAAIGLLDGATINEPPRVEMNDTNLAIQSVSAESSPDERMEPDASIIMQRYVSRIDSAGLKHIRRRYRAYRADCRNQDIPSSPTPDELEEEYLQILEEIRIWNIQNGHSLTRIQKTFPRAWNH